MSENPTKAALIHERDTLHASLLKDLLDSSAPMSATTWIRWCDVQYHLAVLRYNDALEHEDIQRAQEAREALTEWRIARGRRGDGQVAQERAPDTRRKGSEPEQAAPIGRIPTSATRRDDTATDGAVSSSTRRI
jgi:hypothetical protein